MARSSSYLYYFLYISIGFVYPAYCSMVALETKDTKDDAVWLMYWAVFALFHLVEFFGDFILSWFPLYPLCKLLFIAWCVAPIGQNGAYYIYKVFVQPFFRMYAGHIDFYLTQAVRYSKDAASYVPGFQK